MKTYIVMIRVLGGEWSILEIDGQCFETEDLSQALGMRDTVKSPITDTMVVSVTRSSLTLPGVKARTIRYDFVE